MYVKIFLTILFTLCLFSCKPKIKELLTDAYDLETRDKHKEAIAVYNKIIDRDTTIQIAYYNRGICYYNLTEYGKALTDFTKVLAMQPAPQPGIRFRINTASPFAPDEERWKVPYEDALYQRALTKYYMDSVKSAFEDFSDAKHHGYSPQSACTRWLGTIYIQFGKKETGCGLLKESFLAGDTTALQLFKTYCNNN